MNNTIKIDALTYLIRTIQAENSLKRNIVETAHYDEKFHKAMEQQKNDPKKDLKPKEFDMKYFDPKEVETLVDRKSNNFKNNLAVEVDTTSLIHKQTSKTKEKNENEKVIE